MSRVLQRTYAFLADTAALLAAWWLLLFAEWAVLSSAWLRFLAGPWEVVTARTIVAPLAYLYLFLIAPVVVVVGMLLHRLAIAAETRGASRAIFLSLGFGLAALLAFGVSPGRHFQVVPIRALFVLAGGAFGAGVARLLVRFPQWLAGSPGRIGGGAAAIAVGAWWCDAFVLPRLYPAFHLAAFVVCLSALGIVAAAWRSGSSREFHWSGLLAVIPYGLAAIYLHRCIDGRGEIERASNLKILLVERAPALGRAILLDAALRGSNEFGQDPVTDSGAPSVLPVGARDSVRHLDWSQRDVLLISVDALRADHIHAYGYARPITPNIDDLSRQGVTFEHAYCPTPHTSYSVTSMMTGKYMRPLLALGLGEDSETWADYLRMYGYRTAAFFPPAVFFVDGEKFAKLQEKQLGFEYAKIEFAPAERRVAQVDEYLNSVPDGMPLFLWVHLFEPHEPYELHEGFLVTPPAPNAEIAAYDSEISAADDAIGQLVGRVRKARPHAVVMVTADHGEEFGDHGGRYHGTTVYEEQVRVPLIIEGEGISPGRPDAPVQTIDLLPTVLSALGIPRPARVRGRDLGAQIAGGDQKGDGAAGFAFAETDDYALVAEANDRLICARRAGSCVLYNVSEDVRELHEEGESVVAKAKGSELRKTLREIERSHGLFEASHSLQWPEALRRGIQGDKDAADEIVALLDDANVTVRRKAAEVLFSLAATSVGPSVRHACSREDDEEVKRWCTLGGVRTGDLAASQALPFLRVQSASLRHAAALALAARNVAAAGDELVSWWSQEAPPHGDMPLQEQREVLDAIGLLRVRAAVPPLIVSLPDVRSRPYVAETLGLIGDASARPALEAAFATERYVSSRPVLAEALVRLGAHEPMRAPLALFAGLSPPMRGAIAFARRADLLDAAHGGWTSKTALQNVHVSLSAPSSTGSLRLLVLADKPGCDVHGVVDGESFSDGPQKDGVHVVELTHPHHGFVATSVAESCGIVGIWVVSPSSELPPPPPEPWVAARPNHEGAVDLSAPRK